MNLSELDDLDSALLYNSGHITNYATLHLSYKTKRLSVCAVISMVKRLS